MKKIWFIFLSLLTACSSVGNSNTRPVLKQSQKKDSHVILLAGGDNCLGYSYSYHLQEIDGVSKSKFNEYLAGYENVKISYKYMLNSGLTHKEQLSFVNTRIGLGKAADEGIRYGCLGPEIGIAEYLSNMRPNEDFYIIKFAGAGESSFAYQWNIDHGVYYKKMMDFFDQQLRKLSNSNINFDISSFMFVQGETDAKNGNSNYKEYLENFVNEVKLKYHDYSPKNGLSFIDAGISSYYLLNYRNINNYKKEVMASDSCNFYIDTIAGNVTRNKDNMDRVHYDAKGEIKLGNLFAKSYLALQSEHISPDEYVIEEKNNDPLYDDKYVVELIKDGKYVRGNYVFDDNQIHVDVLDDCVTVNDGVSVKYCLAEDDTKINVSDLRKVNLYVDNRVEYFVYSAEKNDFTQASTDYSFINSIKGLINKEQTPIGYRLSASIPNDSKKIFISFGVIKNGLTKYYHDEKIINNDPLTYPCISKNLLVDNQNVSNGQFFGSASNLKSTRGWELSNDYEHISISKGLPLNTVFAYQNNDNVLAFSASFTTMGLANPDFYPKFGIILVDDEFNGIFYYVDAFGDGHSFSGTDLGYCKITGGIFSNYTSLNYSVGTSAFIYQNGYYISLGISRKLDEYQFLCNGVTVAIIQNVTNIGLRKAYFGINTFNTLVDVNNYFFA